MSKVSKVYISVRGGTEGITTLSVLYNEYYLLGILSILSDEGNCRLPKRLKDEFILGYCLQ